MTTDAKQLAIEAAKRLKQVYDSRGCTRDEARSLIESLYGPGANEDTLDQEIAAITSYLTSLPQPDPGPIDAEWLESIGFYATTLSGDIFEHADIAGVFIGDAHGLWSWRIEVYELATLSTRRQLLGLIAALKGGAE